MAIVVPWLLLPWQKEHHAAVVNDLIQTTTNEPDFLKKDVTIVESWVYSCDMETKAQLSQQKSHGCGNSTTKEGVAKLQQDQDHVNCVF